MKFSNAILLSSAGLAAASASNCPTITRTERCSTCAVPFCIPVVPLTVPCGCPTAVPETTVVETCGGPSACSGGCVSTDYSIIPGPCPTTTTKSITTSTKKKPTKTSCPTITNTVYNQECGASGTAVPGGCIIADCILEDRVTVPCSCVADLPLKTKTVTECGCRAGCATTSVPEYLPCPQSPPPPAPTSS